MIDRGVGFAEELLCLLDALLVDIFGDSAAAVIAKAFIEDVFGDMKRFAQMGNAQIIVEVIFNVGGGEGNEIAVVNFDGILKENVRKEII